MQQLAHRRRADAAAGAGHDGGAVAIERHRFSLARRDQPHILAAVGEQSWRRKSFPTAPKSCPSTSGPIRSGPFVFVSGTTSLDAKGRVQGKDAAEQTMVTMRKIEAALKSAGCAAQGPDAA